MAEFFIVSDVHGFYSEMMKALKRKGFDINNPDHIFVSLGDLLDRGKQPVECLKFVNSLPKERKILIRGNHEDLLVEMLSRGYHKTNDIHSGTVETVKRIYYTYLVEEEPTKHTSDEMYKDVLNSKLLNDYLSCLVDYYEVRNHIFVHGWIPVVQNPLTEKFIYMEGWRNSPEDEWSRARWLNGMLQWYNGIYEPGKTIWCGHWHTSWGHSFIDGDGVEFTHKGSGLRAVYTPFKHEGIVAMDACTVVSGFVNCCKKKII